MLQMGKAMVSLPSLPRSEPRPIHSKNFVIFSTCWFWFFSYFFLFFFLSKKICAVLNTHKEQPPTYSSAQNTTSTQTFFLQSLSTFQEEQKRKSRRPSLFTVDNQLTIISNQASNKMFGSSPEVLNQSIQPSISRGVLSESEFE